MRESARGQIVPALFTGAQPGFRGRSALLPSSAISTRPSRPSSSAAPGGGKVAWILDERGARNLWVAAAPDYKGRRLTSYKEDDGQDLGDIAWSADGRFLVYTRGGDLETNGDIPNPRNLPETPEQAVYAIPFDGGPPRKLSDGRGPAVSRDGHVAFLKNGQIWMTTLDGAKPVEAVHTKASSYELQWSPDGSALAFTSYRGDHSFIGVYRVANKTVTYLDPSVDRDTSPVWSPDGRRDRIPAAGVLLRDLGRSGARSGESVVDSSSGCGDRRRPRGVARRKGSRQRVSRDGGREPKSSGPTAIVWCSLGSATAGSICIRFRPMADARSFSRRASLKSSTSRFRATAARCCFPPIRTISIAAISGAWPHRAARFPRFWDAISAKESNGNRRMLPTEPSRSCVRAPPKSAAPPSRSAARRFAIWRPIRSPRIFPRIWSSPSR